MPSSRGSSGSMIEPMSPVAPTLQVDSEKAMFVQVQNGCKRIGCLTS